MRIFRTTIVALMVFVSLQSVPRAQQNLAFSLFERSLEQLRQESGIPGLSVVIAHDTGSWERGLGFADVERAIRAEPDTPYLVGDITQTLAATLVLQRIERGDFTLNDRIQRWTPLVAEPNATVAQVLRHTSTGVYEYDAGRFAALAAVIEHHTHQPFRRVLDDEILEKLAMRDSAPGHDSDTPQPAEASFFNAADVARYRAVLQRIAVPYRVDLRRRATRSEYPLRQLTAGSGLVASARDLARFDAGLEAPDLLLTNAAKLAMYQRGGPSVPTGLGWFVQSYNDAVLVWHFGYVPNAFSSLIIRVLRPSPAGNMLERDLTFILLANSDGLSAPFNLQQGDVTASLFARLFLRTFVP